MKRRRQSTNVVDSRAPGGEYPIAASTIETIAEWANAGNPLSDEDIDAYKEAVRTVNLATAHAENAATRTYSPPPVMQGSGPLAQLARDSINGATDLLYDYYQKQNAGVPVPRPRPEGM